MSDSALLSRADLVVRGTVSTAAPAADEEHDASRYDITVEEVLKGQAPAVVTVRVPGAYDQYAEDALIVPGAPHFEPGEKVLLFLSSRADGSFGPTQLALGSFHVLHTGEDEDVLERELSDSELLYDHAGIPQRRYRDARKFGEWLRRTNAAETADDAYWSATADARAPTAKFALSEPHGRWFQFAQGISVPIYASNPGQSGLSGGGYSELQEAIATWNNDSATKILLSYAGTSSPGKGLSASDGVSQVLFNDPNDEIDGIFSCRDGGIGAYALWRSKGSAYYNGQLYSSITEGDIVVQDGISCMLNLRGQRNTQELLGHELGHLLGLGHSCGEGNLADCVSGLLQNEAIMRPTIHADGRGASLNSDDRAGIASLYGPETTPNPTPASTPGDSSSGSAGSGGGSMSLEMLLVLAALRRRQRQTLHEPVGR